MKFSTLLFALLVLMVQAGHAQITRSASIEGPQAAKGLSDAEILAKADNIRYRALHQDYSNIANALADSKLEVSDRLTALNRLTETYFGNMPETVTLPANLLKPDGSSFSAKEMGEFMARLTQKPVLDAASKSVTPEVMACLTEFHDTVWQGSSFSRLYPDWVVMFSCCTPLCSGAYLYLAMPAFMF